MDFVRISSEKCNSDKLNNFVKKKVSNLLELHFSEVTSYKIHTLVISKILQILDHKNNFFSVSQNNFGNKIPFRTCITRMKTDWGTKVLMITNILLT